MAHVYKCLVYEEGSLAGKRQLAAAPNEQQWLIEWDAKWSIFRCMHLMARTKYCIVIPTP